MLELTERLRAAVRQEIYATEEINEIGADGYTGNSKTEQRIADKLWEELNEELEYINYRLDKIESEQYKPEYMPDPTNRSYV